MERLQALTAPEACGCACSQGLLDRDVSRRLTAVQALEHAWVRPGGTAPDRPLEGTVVRLPRSTCHYVSVE